MALTHENLLPVENAASETRQETTREHTSETASHIVFGCVAERVRRLVRALL
jgi:putative membrane protein